MNQLFKIAILTTISLITSTSFAECNTDPNLRLIKFPPTDLAIYLTPESTVEKDELDIYAVSYVDYNINYKGKSIYFSNIFNHPQFYYPRYDESLSLTNISDTAKLLKRQSEEKVHSFILLNPEPEDIYSTVEVWEPWNTSINFNSPTFNDPLGDEFATSLFIDDGNCKAAEPDSIITHGPYEIKVMFETGSVIIPTQYYSEIASFSQFIYEKDVDVILEGNADKTEAFTYDGDDRKYLNTLSEKRAQAVKSLMISQYNVDPNKLKNVVANGSSRPVAFSDTEKNRQHNRRVKVYIP